ncbi:ankyrin repeat domain-containing protein [Roseateles sp.]|uniref:ankyrin repeat domain-containing protein n=1 Tax=Roseateles sp. TaxID=1971397 RepID=UPI003D15221A
MASKQPKRKQRDGVDGLGRTPLHYACIDGNSEDVAQFLATGLDANAQDDNGWSPLHFAAQASSVECVTLLIRAGANVSLKDSFGNTALFRAVFSSTGDGATIGILRKAGADPHGKNEHGVSPVILARTIGNYDVAQFFADLPPVDDVA